MSRHILKPLNPEHEVVVGYDEGLKTFFGQVAPTRGDCDSFELIVWVGTREREYQDPVDVVNELSEYAHVPYEMRYTLDTERRTIEVNGEHMVVRDWWRTLNDTRSDDTLAGVRWYPQEDLYRAKIEVEGFPGADKRPGISRAVLIGDKIPDVSTFAFAMRDYAEFTEKTVGFLENKHSRQIRIAPHLESDVIHVGWEHVNNTYFGTVDRYDEFPPDVEKVPIEFSTATGDMDVLSQFFRNHARLSENDIAYLEKHRDLYVPAKPQSVCQELESRIDAIVNRHDDRTQEPVLNRDDYLEPDM